MTERLSAAEAQSWLDDQFGDSRVMAVLRGLDPSETVRLANIAWDIGCTHVEVPIEKPEAVPSLIAAWRAGVDRGRLVGAGTIISEEQLDTAIAAGAAYLVSPGLDAALIARAHERGVAFLPGVANATEILQARALGLRWLKAFPASLLGPGWFSAMHGPFPDVRFIATGGISAANARTMLDAGASVIGVGSALADVEHRAIVAELVRR